MCASHMSTMSLICTKIGKLNLSGGTSMHYPYNLSTEAYLFGDGLKVVIFVSRF